MYILKVLQSIWWLSGGGLYSLLLLIVSYYIPDFIFPDHAFKFQWS